jgi:hypothetical protein
MTLWQKKVLEGCLGDLLRNASFQENLASCHVMRPPFSSFRLFQSSSRVLPLQTPFLLSVFGYLSLLLRVEI